MAITYSEIKSNLDRIASQITKAKQQASGAKDNVSVLAEALSNMAARYSSFVAELNAAAAADPTDELLALAIKEKDKLVAEFSALNTVVSNMKADMDQYNF